MKQSHAGRLETAGVAGMTRRRPATERDLKAMLAPYPSEDMISWPVSQRVGNVKNNYPSLIEPIVLPSASGDADSGGPVIR